MTSGRIFHLKNAPAGPKPPLWLCQNSPSSSSQRWFGTRRRPGESVWLPDEPMRALQNAIQLKPLKRPQQSHDRYENEPLGPPDHVNRNQQKTRIISVASLFVFVVCLVLSFTGHAGDYPIMHFLNRWAGKHKVFDCLVIFLADNYLTSGIFLVSLVWYFWFYSTEPHDRRRILIGTLLAAFSGIFSRVLQLTLPTHLRPLHDPGLNFVLPEGVDPDALNHWNSFPSDHAAVYFGLVAVIFFSNAKAGCLAFFWTALITIGRIYLGYHYPTDSLAGAALGVFAVSLHGRFQLWGARLLSFEKRVTPVFYMLAFFVTYQIATLFDDVRVLLALPCLRAFIKRVLHL